jgi:hypothetical protein
MPEPEKIQLTAPLDFEGQRIEELTVRDLKGKDFMAAIKEMSAIQRERGQAGEAPSAIETAAFLAARAAGLPYDAIEALDVRDFLPLVGRFIPLVASVG